MCKCALCAVDDASFFHVIRLGPKTSVYEKHISVKSTVTGCDVTNCATVQQHYKGSTSNFALHFWVQVSLYLVAWTAKNVSRCTKQVPCIRSQALVARTWNDCKLAGNVGLFPAAKSILHLGIHQNRSSSSLFPATPACVR